MVGGSDGTDLRALSVTSGGILNVNLSTSSITVDTNLTKVGGSSIALGQALAAASLPVVLTAAQISTLTPLSSVTVTQATGSNLHAVLDAGSAVIGKVSIDQTTPGTTNLVALAANQSVNNAQVNGVTVSTGNGVSGTGVQRVAIASDNTAFSVNATLQAASVVIGKVSIDQTTPGTTNLVALAANQSVNVAQINGVTTLMGNGVTGTGSQRVTIASDNTAFSVNAQVIPQSSSTNANSSLASTALETSHVIKASAGRLFQLSGVNTKTSAQYIQVFNSTTVPADATAPVLLAYVPAGGNFSFDFGSIGRYFSTGIAVSNSSTAATKTIGSADCWFNAEYL